jgi:hypothetical protein
VTASIADEKGTANATQKSSPTGAILTHADMLHVRLFWTSLSLRLVSRI